MPGFVSSARRFLVLWISLFALALAGCSSSPEDVVKDFYKAVADNRVEDAVGYFSLQGIKENDLTQAKGKFQMMVGELHSTIKARGGLDSVLATPGEQKDDSVRVEVELKFKNGTTKKESLKLAKESGKWKIRL